MRKLLQVVAASVALAVVSTARAQALHHGYIWIEGPEEPLAPDSAYTLEVWGRWESPLFEQYSSAMAWFGMDILNARGSESVAEVSAVRFAFWASQFGQFDAIDGTHILGVESGQLNNVDSTPDGSPDRSNPIMLFRFDFTTEDGPIEIVEFRPANPGPYGGLAFYPYLGDSWAIAAPNDADTELHLTGWTSAVPSPGAVVGLVTLIGAGKRRRQWR